MQRFRSLFFCAFVLLLTLGGCSSSSVDSGTYGESPNVLFISMDDLNDWVGYLGGHSGMEIHTPNLDRLAETSFVFTNAHTPSPSCAPARTAIMTGVYPWRSGYMANFNGDGPIWRESEALRDVETIEQFFQNNGYTTLGGGKLYHSQAPPWTTTSQVEPESWDFYYPSPYLTHPHQIRPPDEVIYPDRVDNESRPGGQPGWWTWGPVDEPEEKMADRHLVDWAAHEMERPHDKPFFLAAGTWKPHDPWEVPQKYFDMYPLEEVVLPEHRENDLADAFDHGRRGIQRWVLENGEWERIVQAYAATITFADAQVGRLLDALENSRHADNTIVVLWSDHGMHMGEKENFEKFTLWERSTHVPFLLRVPGMEAPVSRIDQPVSLLDIYPTLAHLIGSDVPEHIDGTSLLPLLENPQAERGPVLSSYRFGYNRAWHMGPMRDNEIGHAIRSANYRYIYYEDTRLEELYDRRNDPGEWENVAYREEFADVVREHREILQSKIPSLTLDTEHPEGYEIGEDGSIRYNDFIPMREALN